MDDRRFTINDNEIVFFISYSILLFVLILSTSFYQQYLETLWKPVFAFCLALILLNEAFYGWLCKQDIAWLLIIVICMILTGYYAKGPADNSIVFLFAFIFCGRRISFEKIATVSLIVSTVALVIIVASASLGLILNYVEYGVRLRYYLGFRYSLFGPVLLANITKLWTYIRKQKFSFIEFGLLLVINYYFYYRTNSRLAFFLTALFLLVVFILKKWPSLLIDSRLICTLMIGAFIIAAMISIMMTVKYDPTSAWMVRVNDIFGKRLSLGKDSIETYGITLFPNPNFNITGNGLDIYGNKSLLTYNYVDCFYVQLLQKYGVVLFVGFIITVTYTMYIGSKRKDAYYLVIMVFIAAHCMIDDLLMYINYNTFWMAAGGFIAANYLSKATDKSLE